MEVLKSYSPAYFDSFSGLIPCKVIAIVAGEFNTIAHVRLTASRGIYSKGELVETATNRAVPRKSVRHRAGIARILPYLVECDDTEQPAFTEHED